MVNMRKIVVALICFFFSSRRRHTRFDCDWSSDVCSSDLDRRAGGQAADQQHHRRPRGVARSAGAGARRPRAEERSLQGRRAGVSREAQPELHVRRRPMKPLAILLAVLVAAPMLLAPPVATAADDFKIALVAPLSGRWARQGQLKKMGAEMAIAEINAQGGIKALGGAKIVLREADAGDSVEKAVSAAQRVLAREKISAGIGAWLSSFTLGVTEVAERLEVPWFTLSYADSITERGFK